MRVMLIECATNGLTPAMELLLKAGANVHADNDEALWRATYYGHTECVKLLLTAGANVHAWNDRSLRWANRYGHVECVKLLLEQYIKGNKNG